LIEKKMLQGISKRGAIDKPDTPSPKKKRVGGSLKSRYGRIACDLSCPNPLFHATPTFFRGIF